MKLSFYIASRFLTTFALVLGGFFAVLYLLDMIDQVRRLPEASFGRLAGLALLHTPGTLYRILPLVMILAAIALFLRLARTSELVAIRAAGRSALRTLAAPVMAAFLLGVVAVALINPIVAATSKRYAALTGTGAGISDASISSDGLWLRQGGDEVQWVIRADSADPDGTALYGVSFLSFTATGDPASRIEAASARLENGRWIASDAKQWDLSDTENPEASASILTQMTLTSDLTADQIRDSFGAPETVSIWDMPTFIGQLDRAGFSSRRHAVWFQMELALPLLLAAMVMVGAGFTMRHARFGQSGTLVLVALVSGIAVFFVRNFAQVLGESGQIPIVLAAWTPPVAAALLSVSLLLHLEDG